MTIFQVPTSVVNPTSGDLVYLPGHASYADDDVSVRLVWQEYPGVRMKASRPRGYWGSILRRSTKWTGRGSNPQGKASKALPVTETRPGPMQRRDRWADREGGRMLGTIGSPGPSPPGDLRGLPTEPVDCVSDVHSAASPGLLLRPARRVHGSSRGVRSNVGASRPSRRRGSMSGSCGHDAGGREADSRRAALFE